MPDTLACEKDLHYLCEKDWCTCGCHDRCSKDCYWADGLEGGCVKDECTCHPQPKRLPWWARLVGGRK